MGTENFRESELAKRVEELTRENEELKSACRAAKQSLDDALFEFEEIQSLIGFHTAAQSPAPAPPGLAADPIQTDTDPDGGVFDPQLVQFPPLADVKPPEGSHA